MRQVTAAELPGSFQQQFRNRAVRRGGTVVLLTGHKTRGDLVQAAFLAVGRGAKIPAQ
jgi:hypothetical protein